MQGKYITTRYDKHRCLALKCDYPSSVSVVQPLIYMWMLQAHMRRMLQAFPNLTGATHIP